MPPRPPQKKQIPAGGTLANCFSAACRKGAPLSKFLPAGAPVYNATCYCPYVTTRQPFLMSSADYPCGPANASDVKPSTLIYNGGWVGGWVGGCCHLTSRLGWRLACLSAEAHAVPRAEHRPCLPVC